jgi:hypothetical protein
MRTLRDNAVRRFDMARRQGVSAASAAIKVIATSIVLAGAATPLAFAQRAVLVAPANGIPLMFGMSPQDVSQVLAVPLFYVRGRPGDELLLAIPNVKGAALASRSDGLYLQFRKGRLTGWKGDWGTIRP